MTVAVSRALATGRNGRRLRVDRQHGRVGRGIRGARGAVGGDPAAAGRGRARQARAGARGRRPARRGARQLRPGAPGRAGARRLAGSTCSSTRSTRTASRARRRRPSRSPKSSAAFPTCSRCRTAAAETRAPTHAGFTEWDAGMPRFLAGAAARRGETLASAIRIVDPAHRAEAEAAVRDSGGAVVALTDDEIVAAWRSLAEQEGVFCEPASAAGLAAVQKVGASGTGRRRRHRPRAQGSGRGRPHRRADRRGRRGRDRGRLRVTDPVRVRAPATTANLGPGFDCAAAALDLWNELDRDRGRRARIRRISASAPTRCSPTRAASRFDFTDPDPA